MLPRLAKHDSAYGCLRAFESSAEILLGYASHCVETTNLARIGIGDICKGVGFTADLLFWMRARAVLVAEFAPFRIFAGPVLFTAYGSPLLGAIAHVLGLGSKEEVPRITAKGTVTRVADKQAGRNLSEMEHPAHAVSRNTGSSNVESPISEPAPHHAAGPQPAFLWRSFIHVPPKASLDFWRNLGQEVATQIRSHTTGLVRALRSLQRPLRPSFLAAIP